MKTRLAAAVVALLAAAASAELPAPFGPVELGRFRFKPAAAAPLIDTPETRMLAAAKPGVFRVLVAIKWADVADADLPYDASRLGPEFALMLQALPREKADEMAQQLGLKRVTRDMLPEYQTLGGGTGFAVKTSDGRLLGVTNVHVASLAAQGLSGAALKTEIHIKASDDPFSQSPAADDMTAELAALSPKAMDIALLKLPAGAWTPLELADSSTVDVGEEAWAMGFPSGLNCTATRGIVSAVDVALKENPYVSYVQTDAAINPGNSGGPLLRMRRRRPEVLGMNTLLISRSGGSDGLGFALEASAIRRALAQYARTGRIAAGDAGLELAPSTGTVNAPLVVTSVVAEGPAAKAGIKAGDGLTAADGESLDSDPKSAQFQVARAIRSKDPGAELKLGLLRGEEGFQVALTLGEEAPAKK